ncbi:MATN2 protein, partial [Polypterus senegalus]
MEKGCWLESLCLLGIILGICAGQEHICGENINECASDQHDCDPNLAICIDTDFDTQKNSGFYCVCKDGYDGNGKVGNCTDINECAVRNGGCPQYCLNTVGSYKCQCYLGYRLGQDNITCTDVNECASGNGGCHQLCINTDGSYQCQCDKGYMLSPEHNCTDIDECANGNASCSHLCTNTDGSYKCHCYSGFVLGPDNASCTGVDECGEQCHPDSICVQRGNISNCECKAGYEGNGKNCTGMRFYVLNLMESETDLSIGCGPLPSEQPKVTFYGLDIPPGTTKEFYLECEQLWAKLASSSSQSSVGMKVWYEMVNPCLDMECDVNAECSVNSAGYPVCICNAGWTGSGAQCYENVCPYVTIPPFNGVYQRSYCSQTSGFLLSPSYPAEYTSNEDVAWWMNLTNSEAIQFNLLNFSTEAKQDFFYIFNSSLMNSSYIEYEISGKTGSLQDTHFQNQMAEVADILHLKRPADDDSIATRFISDRAHNGYFKIFFQKEFTEVVSLRCTTMCTKVLLQWEMNAESLPIQNFRVAYGRIDQNCVSVNRTSGSANEIILSNLTPYQEYLIDVIADVYTGQTEGKSCMVKTTCFGAPQFTLSNMKLWTVGSSALLSWVPMTVFGFQVLSYNVRWRCSNEQFSLTVPASESSILLTGLKPNCTYAVYIQCMSQFQITSNISYVTLPGLNDSTLYLVIVSSMSVQEASSPLYFFTGALPLNVSATALSTTSVLINWTVPLTGIRYEIQYARSGDNISYILYTTEKFILLQGLLANATYDIKVTPIISCVQEKAGCITVKTLAGFKVDTLYFVAVSALTSMGGEEKGPPVYFTLEMSLEVTRVQSFQTNSELRPFSVSSFKPQLLSTEELSIRSSSILLKLPECGVFEEAARQLPSLSGQNLSVSLVVAESKAVNEDFKLASSTLTNLTYNDTNIGSTGPYVSIHYLSAYDCYSITTNSRIIQRDTESLCGPSTGGCEKKFIRARSR